MTKNSELRDWYRQEELARDRARTKMRSRRGASLTPMYVLAAVIGAGVLFLLIAIFGDSLSSWPR